MQDRIAVLVSGRGSNLQALLEKEGCNIRLVCSNKKNSLAILKAKRFGIATKVFSPLDFKELENYLLEKRIAKILLLGFMRIIPESFIQKWPNKIINLHPSLLPLFPGLHAQENSYRSSESMGVSLHYVIPAMDQGPLIDQSLVYSHDQKPESMEEARYGLTFREHFMVRKLGDKWT